MQTMRYLFAILLLAAGCARQTSSPLNATKDQPFVNTLGMKFVPVPGTQVLFSIWETRAQDYEAFLKASGQPSSNTDTNRGPTHPAANVSWDDAIGFCMWLTRKEHAERKLGDQFSYRLPTDEEWSLAVGLPPEKGDTPEAKNGKIVRHFPWGKEWPPPAGAGKYAGAEEEPKGTAPVGSFTPNNFGLYDLGGNVWEWCEDWFNTNRDARVLRGASALNAEQLLLYSSWRVRNGPSVRDEYYGFRCVLVLKSPAP